MLGVGRNGCREKIQISIFSLFMPTYLLVEGDVNFFSASIGAGETELVRNGTGLKALISGRRKRN